MMARIATISVIIEYCSQESEAGIDIIYPGLKKLKTFHHPVSTGSQTYSSCFPYSAFTTPGDSLLRG